MSCVATYLVENDRSGITTNDEAENEQDSSGLLEINGIGVVHNGISSYTNDTEIQNRADKNTKTDSETGEIIVDDGVKSTSLE